jgi:hypothetical protein
MKRATPSKSKPIMSVKEMNILSVEVLDTIFKRLLREAARDAAQYERTFCVLAIKECKHVCATAECDCAAVQKKDHIEALLARNSES